MSKLFGITIDTGPYRKGPHFVHLLKLGYLEKSTFSKSCTRHSPNLSHATPLWRIGQWCHNVLLSECNSCGDLNWVKNHVFSTLWAWVLLGPRLNRLIVIIYLNSISQFHWSIAPSDVLSIYFQKPDCLKNVCWQVNSFPTRESKKAILYWFMYAQACKCTDTTKVYSTSNILCFVQLNVSMSVGTCNSHENVATARLCIYLN